MTGRSIATPFYGIRFRDQRERAGFTQVALVAALAEADHVLDQSVISNWETGRSKPRPASLSAVVGLLADRLEVSHEEMLRRLGEPVPAPVPAVST